MAKCRWPDCHKDSLSGKVYCAKHIHGSDLDWQNDDIYWHPLLDDYPAPEVGHAVTDQSPIPQESKLLTP